MALRDSFLEGTKVPNYSDNGVVMVNKIPFQRQPLPFNK